MRLTEEESEQAQIVGMDEYDMGEFAYDYVGLEQEITGEDGVGLTVGGREPQHHHRPRPEPSQHSSSSDDEKKPASTVAA